MVNSPEHYTEGGIETLDYLKAKSNTSEYMGYLRLNCLKYLSRAPYKGTGTTDLKKCFYYLNILIDELEEHPPSDSALIPGKNPVFIQRQLDVSEKLFKVMKQDHKERSKDFVHLEQTVNSLLKKLDKANEEIKDLRNGGGQEKEKYYGA